MSLTNCNPCSLVSGAFGLVPGKDAAFSSLQSKRLLAQNGKICSLEVCEEEIDGSVTSEQEFSYFNSDIFTSQQMVFDSVAPVLRVLEPDLPSTFQMFELAETNNTNIISSGANSQFIHTTEAGVYDFHIQFTIENTSQIDTDPDLVLLLGDSTATFYTGILNTNPAVTTVFEPFTIAQVLENTAYLAVMKGVVTLPANAMTAVLINQTNVLYNMGSFCVTVKRLA